MKLRYLQNQKATAIISADDYARIKQCSRARERNVQVDPTTSAIAAKHEKALKMTAGWSNSITNTRKARIGRLQAEAEAHEEELKGIDERERTIQKESRRKVLTEAEKKRFNEKQEIRAVNSHLLLHETMKEREQQILMKEKKRAMQQEQEEQDHAEQIRQIRAAEDKERDNMIRRREKDIAAAKEFKRQKEELEDRKLREREEEAEDEQMLAQEAARQLQQEQEAEAKRRAAERQNRDDVRRGNDDMIAFKERQEKIEALEDERILKQKLALDAEQDQRAAAEKERRAQRQAAIDSLIQKGQDTLEKTRAQQQTFEDTQYEHQFKKDQEAMQTIARKQERLRQERHQDYLEAQAKIEARRKQTTQKRIFPHDEETIRAQDATYELERQKMDSLKDIAAYQQQQIREKKERDASEKERSKLEYQHMIEQQETKTLEAQEYAAEMLTSCRRH